MWVFRLSLLGNSEKLCRTHVSVPPEGHGNCGIHLPAPINHWLRAAPGDIVDLPSYRLIENSKGKSYESLK